MVTKKLEGNPQQPEQKGLRPCSARSMYSIDISLEQMTGIAPEAIIMWTEFGRASVMFAIALQARSIISGL